MSHVPDPGDPLVGLPPRPRMAELILGGRPQRDTYSGWQHYRAHRGRLVPPPALTPDQWRIVPAARRTDYDL
ncbi:hypothetical protein [Streptomyces sp. TRM49041]|uniref:hypothetical protein n=1 Tax=Streptomyces sp. TRM49041 TaxID=2603216 RepID=UPI0021CCCE01|nr:hypothetical protein [Streptomyces sp. TRM49041]